MNGRDDRIGEVLRPWMARNAPPPPAGLLLRIMDEIEARELSPRRTPWLLTTQPLAAVAVTAVFAILAVAIGLALLNAPRGGVPTADPAALMTARVNILLETLHQGTAEEYAALYAPDAITYGNTEDRPTQPGIGRAGVIAGFNNFRATATHLDMIGPVTSWGPFATFHFRWENGLGYSGDGVTTLLFNDEGLVVYDAGFLTLDP